MVVDIGRLGSAFQVFRLLEVLDGRVLRVRRSMRVDCKEFFEGSCVFSREYSSMSLNFFSGLFFCLRLQTADEIAKLHGSKLEDWQVKAFRGMIDKFVKRQGGIR